MNPEQQRELEKLEKELQQELTKLPLLAAPPGVVQGVMQRLAAQASQPWWQLSWWNWPIPAKAAFLMVTLLVAAAFSGGGMMLDQRLADYSQTVTEGLSPFSVFAETVRTLAEAGLLLWENLAQPFVIYVLVIVSCAYLACIGLGTAVVRYALKSSRARS